MRYAFGIALVCIIAAAAVVARAVNRATPAVPAASEPDKVARGKYLVAIMGCNDCHTPLKMTPTGPASDSTRFLAGHPEEMGALTAPATTRGPWLWAGAATNTAFSGPWGVSYAANLTPDENTGLGIWTEEMFVKALRTGKHMGVSRPIAPPMPWPAVRNATDEDLKAMFAYLRTIKPLTNHVPDYQPAGEAAVAPGQ